MILNVFQFNEDLIINQPTAASLSFVNPLDRPLSGGEFRVTSSGVSGRSVRLAAPDVPPHELVSVELPVLPNVSTLPTTLL